MHIVILLHNEYLHDLCSSPNIRQVIRLRMRMRGPVAHMGERSSAYRDLVGKPERKRPLVRPRHRWEGNIRMNLKEVRWGTWNLEGGVRLHIPGTLKDE
jgi:hypothetical protein